jgi:beta-ureidopropionase / N-carbamoyl-L-amino-acid hydrolase
MVYAIAQLNQMDRSQFTDALGHIFEQTPTIAAAAWEQQPFEDGEALYQAMVDVLWQLPSDQQLDLIRSHPDLGSRIKMAEASIQEQAGVGLDRLSPELFLQFQMLNQQYRDRFDFPFIIAVKNHTQESILQAFTDRLQNPLEIEFKQALLEILTIARFRLLDLVDLEIDLNPLANRPPAPNSGGAKLKTLEGLDNEALLVVNGDRLMARIFELATIGGLANGGVCRLAFTDEDIKARQQVSSWMEEAGMTVRVDTAGNLIGRYAGVHDTAAIGTGSHIDTVPVGGRYDGVLGVLAGIELVQTLQDHDLQLQHPIEVIVFSDEERSVIGCKAMSGGILEAPEYYARTDGTSIQSCLEKVGGNWDQIHTAKRDRSDIVAFIELHVEQGGVLESQGVPIGIVQGIVGQHRFAVKITGRMNHAGTTPMTDRQDALLAAAKIIVAVNEIATSTPGDQVATVGYLKVLPNATNTVAGEADLRIDLRDLSGDNLIQLIQRIRHGIMEIAIATKTRITFEEMLNLKPTLAKGRIQETISQACHTLQLDHYYLPSRAGHDAQEIGRFTAMGMIFVPSQQGLSHSEAEYTSPEHCIQGANVLLQSFLAIDRQETIK